MKEMKVYEYSTKNPTSLFQENQKSLNGSQQTNLDITRAAILVNKLDAVITTNSRLYKLHSTFGRARIFGK